MRWWLLAFALLSSAGCGATRKISQVGLREPSSLHEASQVSEWRGKALGMSSFPKSCTKDISHFSALAGEKVSFPSCPKKLVDAVNSDISYLLVEDRTTLEEVVAGQCRSFSVRNFSGPVDSLFESFDLASPVSRAEEYEREGKSFADLSAGIQELKNHHLPLERWVRRNGEFVLPDEEIALLFKLIVESSCRMSNIDVEPMLGAVRTLEELINVLPEGPQLERIRAFRNSVDGIVGERIREYF